VPNDLDLEYLYIYIELYVYLSIYIYIYIYISFFFRILAELWRYVVDGRGRWAWLRWRVRIIVDKRHNIKEKIRNNKICEWLFHNWL